MNPAVVAANYCKVQQMKTRCTKGKSNNSAKTTSATKDKFNIINFYKIQKLKNWRC